MLDQQTQRAIDLVWEQGINVIRGDVQKLAQHMQDLVRSNASARRWFFGVIITVIPAYIGVALALFKR